MAASNHPVPGAWVRDDRGSVFTEYVVVLTMVTVVAAVALAACGLPLLQLFRAQSLWLGLPFP